jgi:hypothetical protein
MKKEVAKKIKKLNKKYKFSVWINRGFVRGELALAGKLIYIDGKDVSVIVGKINNDKVANIKKATLVVQRRRRGNKLLESDDLIVTTVKEILG